MNKNKQRGKRFEDKIAKIIRDCWNLKKDECHRAQSSGTFTTDYSDIIIRPFEYKVPHIVIECKYRNVRTITYNKLLNPGSLLDDFYEQVCNASKKYMSEYDIKPLPIIVHGVPNMRPLLSIEETNFIELQQNSLKFNLIYHTGNYDELTLVMRVRTPKLRFIQMFVDEFFYKLISPVRR